MSRLCLDTSAYSHFKRGDEAVVRLLSEANWVGVSVVVLAELRFGFSLGRHTKKNEADLLDFLGHPVVQVLEVDDEAARLYVEMALDLRRIGKPIPTNDLWIAAVAAREGATIVTYDAHFEAIRMVGSRILTSS